MHYFGIDLGSTNSCIAGCNENSERVFIVPTVGARNITPSVVYLPESDGPEVVGELAVNQLRIEPQRVVTYTKRLIANDNKFKEEGAFDNYPTFKGIKQNPITISSMILKSLTFNNPGFKELIGKDDFRAVVTFPAYFTDEAKARTKQAAELAGLNKVEMIEEPFAAAIAYGIDCNQTVLVYDLGGATFDVTVIHFDRNGNGKILAKDGDPYLGGGDWDNILGYYLWQRYNEMHKQEISLTIEDFDYLKNNKDMEISALKRVNKFRLLAQKVKHLLTDLEETDVLMDDDDDTMIHVTRKDFDEQTNLLLLRTFSLMDEVIEDQNITSVLLVGGSSLMPQVKAGLEENYSQFIGKIHLCDPQLAVAKGAAIYCNKIYGPSSRTMGIIIPNYDDIRSASLPEDDFLNRKRLQELLDSIEKK